LMGHPAQLLGVQIAAQQRDAARMEEQHNMALRQYEELLHERDEEATPLLCTCL
jgi:hypothetical protein